MPEITAKLVNELRARTGQGMMECKKMLTEVAGDIDKAIDAFRKKGVKSSLAERTASEGRVTGVAAKDGKSAALVEVNCNTDFTAKSEPIAALGKGAAEALLCNPTANPADTLRAQLTAASQTTGENVQTGKTGVLMQFAGDVANVTD